MPTDQAIRTTIKVSKTTDREAHSISGPKRVRKEIEFGSPEWDAKAQQFRETLNELHKYTQGIDPAIIEAEVDAALAEVRAEKRARMALAKTGS